MPRPPRVGQANCHPDRPHYCRGYCNACYTAAYRKTNGRKPEMLRPEYTKQYYKNNKEKIRAINKRNHYLRSYGITLEQREKLLIEQDFKCPICKCELIKPHVDHNHKTGKVRAILCDQCNRGIGCFFDNPTFLRNAAIYVENHKT